MNMYNTQQHRKSKIIWHKVKTRESHKQNTEVIVLTLKHKTIKHYYQLLLNQDQNNQRLTNRNPPIHCPTQWHHHWGPSCDFGGFHRTQFFLNLPLLLVLFWAHSRTTDEGGREIGRVCRFANCICSLIQTIGPILFLTF